MVDKGVGFLVTRIHLVLAVAALRDSAKSERGAEPPVATELHSIPITIIKDGESFPKRWRG